MASLCIAACCLAAPASLGQDGQIEPAPAAATGGDDDTDRRLEQRLSDVFAQVDEFASLEATVEAGVVHLRGSAETEDGERAVELASSFEGVLYVDSDIAQHTDLQERLLPTLGRLTDGVRDLLAHLPLLLVALVVFAGFWLLAHLLTRSDVLVGKLSGRRLVQDLLKQILRTLLLVAGAFVALDILGATAVVGAVLGAAGVVGLALSFAFRDIVENYLASILLSIRSPFVADDVVEIDGQVGVVVRLTTSETMLMSFDGNHVRLPNATVFKATIVNRTRNPRRRFDFSVGVGVDENLTLAQELGLETMAQLPSVLDDPGPYALVDELGDSNVALRFFGWIDQRESDFGKVRSHAIRLVKTVLDDHEIEMPSPIYDVHLHRSGGQARAADAGELSHADDGEPRRRRTAEVLADAREADTSPDTEIHEQIREEKATSGEDDLLDEQAALAAKGRALDDAPA